MATKKTAKKAPKKTSKASETKNLFLVSASGDLDGPLTCSELQQLIENEELTPSCFDNGGFGFADYTVIRGEVIKPTFAITIP